MTTLTTITSAGILSPEEIGPLIIKPLTLKSVALRSTTTINASQSSLRFPIVSADATAQLVDEGAAIPETQADVSELSVTPVAFKALTTVSNELVADAAVNAAAAEVIGQGLVRQFQRKLDAAWLANATLLTPSNSVGTLGLKSLADIQNVDVVGAITNLDPFLSAISEAEKVGAQLTSFVRDGRLERADLAAR